MAARPCLGHALILLLSVGCGPTGAGTPTPDAAPASQPDAAAGAPDAATTQPDAASPPDAALPDARPPDAAPPDAWVGPPPTQLAGRLDFVDFVIPAGATHTITGDAVIVAQGKVDIAGALLVAPNASVVLAAGGDLTITGRMVPLAAPTEPATARWLFAGAAVRVGLAAGSEIRGPYLGFTTRGDGRVEIAGLVAESGLAARSRAEPGQEGGSIEIGTQIVRDGFALRGIPVRDRPGDLVIGAAGLTAGSGGRGFDDAGALDMGELVARGSDGGKGGSIVMFADRLDTTALLTDDLMRAGGGGKAGGCTIAGAADGEKEGAPGTNARCTSGHGGDGGSVVVLAQIDDPPGTAGTGGDGPSISIAAGNGGLAGKGGDAVVVVGAPGEGGTARSLPLPSQAGDVRFAGGGNGGAGTVDSTVGGAGGIVRVTGPDDGLAVLEQAIAIGPRVAAGGAGFDGCPISAGGKGGAGGALIVKGASYVLEGAAAFNGGNGGNGSPPGAGGAAGRDDANALVGNAGRPGGSCSGSTVPQAFELLQAPSYFSNVVLPITGGLVAGGQDLSGSGKAFLHVVDNGAMLPATRFQVTYDGRDIRDLYPVSPADPQTDFIVGGKTSTGRSWVARIDAAGAPVWETLLLDDPNSPNLINAVAPATGGGTLAVGSYAGHGLFVKLGATGQVVCQKQIGGAGGQVLIDVAPAADGGGVAVGQTTPQSTLDGWAAKLTAACAVEWSMTLAGAADDLLVTVSATPDGGWLAGGGTRSAGQGDFDGWMVKLGATGAIVTQKVFGGPAFDEVTAVSPAGTGFALAGVTVSAGSGGQDMFFIATSATGEATAQKTYGTAAGGELAVSLTALSASDGGFLLGGSSGSSSLAVRTDASGGVALCEVATVGKDAPTSGAGAIVAAAGNATATANGFTATDLTTAAKSVTTAGTSYAGAVDNLCLP